MSTQTLTKDFWKAGIEPEIENWFQQNDIYPYVEKVRDVIHEAFGTVKFIEVSMVEDPEIPDNQKIRFAITLSGKPAQILKSEDRFDNLFYMCIPEEKQTFFTFIYRVENESS